MIWDLLRNRKGNFSLTTAFIMAPMAALAGFAVDFTNTLMIRSQIEAAADAAALGSISEKSAGVSTALGMAEGDVQSGQDDALKLFNGQIAGMSGFKVVSASAQITKSANVLKSTIFYTVEVPTTFTKAIGKQSITFSGQATAEYAMQTFRDFYLLLDNTPSMGVGATTADINKLVANTSDKCAFACHINNAGVEDKKDYYNLAKRLGVTTRIDVLAKATASLMDTAMNTRTVSNQYRMAIYTFGEKAEDTKLLEVAPLTGDLLSAKQKAAGVQLMTIPYQGYNNDTQTSFDTALTQIKAKIGTQGNGVSSSSPEKVLFFVADGVGDSYKPTGCTKKTTSGRCQEPIDLKYCQALKDANYKIAVLYTTYLPLPTNSWYNTWIAPFQSEISSNMQKCASEGLFFEVSPTQGISDAMNALFMRIVSAPRLTG